MRQAPNLETYLKLLNELIYEDLKYCQPNPVLESKKRLSQIKVTFFCKICFFYHKLFLAGY